MADEMNTERDMPEGITRDDTVHGETYYTASDMATASANGFRVGRASLAANAGSDGVASLSAAEPTTPEFSEAQIASVCMSYRHDFGLLGETDRKSMIWTARQWERAFAKEREWATTLTQGAAIAAGAFCNKKQFDAQGFYQAIERDVSARKITWRELSIATGVSQTTLTRMGQGRKPDAASMAALSAWAGINPANYFKGASPQPDIAAGAVYAELPSILKTPDLVQFDAREMRAFADATHALRTSHGQAPAVAAPAVAPSVTLASGLSLHPRTADLVQRFTTALAEKLARAEKKYGYRDGWASPDCVDGCQAALREHLRKGDPRDVAAYCAFLWHHGAVTTMSWERPAYRQTPSPQAAQQAPPAVDTRNSGDVANQAQQAPAGAASDQSEGGV